jgi:hypothetical protein
MKTLFGDRPFRAHEKRAARRAGRLEFALEMYFGGPGRRGWGLGVDRGLAA